VAPRRYQALVFDLGGVIASHDNGLLYRGIAARCTAPDALARIRGSVADRDLGTGRVLVREIHRRLRETLGLTVEWPEFAELWCTHLGLDPVMLDYVEALAREQRVLLFSNTNAEHWDFLVQLSAGRLGRLEAYLSHEIGQVKPDAEAFLDVARRAGIEPRHSLFIDDIAANIDGARAVGFEALLFTGQAALAGHLAAAARPPV
jgi:HAD superfamily hydrolase (TIGR01509 family)